jgi:hypothetical protein
LLLKCESRLSSDSTKVYVWRERYIKDPLAGSTLIAPTSIELHLHCDDEQTQPSVL